MSVYNNIFAIFSHSKHAISAHQLPSNHNEVCRYVNFLYFAIVTSSFSAPTYTRSKCCCHGILQDMTWGAEM